MPIRQAGAVNAAVAAHLKLEVDRTAWAQDLRRNEGNEPDLVAFADSIITLGRKVNLAYLRRTVDRDALTRLVAEGAYPLVILASAAGGVGGWLALVVTGRDGAEITGYRIGEDGAEQAFTGTLDGLLPSAGAGVDAEMLCLIPLGVTPLVAAEAGDHDATPTSRLWQMLVREKRDIWLVWLYALLVGLFGLALPLGVQATIQLVQGGLLIQPLFLLIAFVVLGSLASGALQIFQLSVVEVIQQRVFARLAVEFAFRIPRFRMETALAENLPEQMNRFFEALTIQKSLSKLLTDAVAALVTIIFGLILLSVYNPFLSLSAVTLIAVLGFLLAQTGARGLYTSIVESKYKYRVVHWFEEMTRAVTAFKFAGRSNLAIDRTDELLTGYLKYRKKHFSVIVQQSWFFVIFKTVITGAMLVLGAVLLQDRQITIGQFVASELVIVTVLSAIEKIIASLSTVYDVLTAVDKVGHVTDFPLDAAGGLSLRNGQGSGLGIELRNVSYAYPGVAAPALTDIDLSVKAGERIGITGFVGAGSSSLLLLASGLLDDYSGTITYDGITLRDLDRTSLRGAIGQYLSQTDLFDGTIEDNITVGRPNVDVPAVMQALERVGLSTWVQEQPMGLRTAITNGGRNLSTSIATRLLLAQAIAGAPRLLVLDDFFTIIEPLLRERVHGLIADRSHPWTALVVTHDPMLLAACDRVLVMKDGRIAATGTWAECEAHPEVRRFISTPAHAGAA
ncbi:MAG: ATP-binding cassette domain-containing protein [Gemmatimonadaceae bacterium]|nr:ATP-binding cassette domain-containing protein [Gemmatimonadaceae bacterium]